MLPGCPAGGYGHTVALPGTVRWLPGLALRCSAASNVLGLCLHTS